MPFILNQNVINTFESYLMTPGPHCSKNHKDNAIQWISTDKICNQLNSDLSGGYWIALSFEQPGLVIPNCGFDPY